MSTLLNVIDNLKTADRGEKKPNNMILKSSEGFTLLEALLSVALLGLLGYSVSGLYFTGMRSLDEQAERMMLDSRLRGRMEVLIGTSFDQIADGSESINVNGKDYTITWTAVFADINDDSTPDSDAKLVTVSISGLPDRELSSIIVDNQGRIGKI